MNTEVQAVVHPTELTPAWMTHVLGEAGVLEDGAQVRAIDRAPCGTGQLADSFRFTLTYGAGAQGPPTVVGKFASDEETSRAFGRDSGYYRTEVRFYQELAPTLSNMALPTALHAALADNETDFVLLMDDLAPARAVDQLVGCTADEAAMVVEQLAALHAASWGSRALASVDWLKGTTASFLQITDGFPATTANFHERFGDLVDETDIAEAAKLNNHLDAWKTILATPRSLWHSDLRADNLLFDAQGGEVPVVLLDWQGLGYGNGPIDLAFFLGTSLQTDVRRANERELVALYRQKLTALGVQGYSERDAWTDYRVLAIQPLQTGVFGLGAVRRSERGDQMWRNWIERAAQQTRDLDSYTALKAL